MYRSYTPTILDQIITSRSDSATKYPIQIASLEKIYLRQSQMKPWPLPLPCKIFWLVEITFSLRNSLS